MDFGAMMQSLPQAMQQVDSAASTLERIATALERIADMMEADRAVLGAAISEGAEDDEHCALIDACVLGYGHGTAHMDSMGQQLHRPTCIFNGTPHFGGCGADDTSPTANAFPDEQPGSWDAPNL